MALPTWIPDALRSEQGSLEKKLWRCVEAQHIVSTMKIVSSLPEQYLLEDILEEDKPEVPNECNGLHYLFMTPFRYGLYKNGSRFRRAGFTSGVFYSSESPSTALFETAFHLFLFYAESENLSFPSQPSEHTIFDVPVKSKHAIDLTRTPFNNVAPLWTHRTNYEPCQQLEEIARQQGVQLIRYSSVRDPDRKANVAILNCSAFASTAPKEQQTWQLSINSKGLDAFCRFRNERISVSSVDLVADERLRKLWTS